MQKVCICSPEPKAASAFTKVAANPDGLHKLCRECKNKQAREWRKQNPEKVKAAKKRERAKRPETLNAANKAWRLKNPDRKRENWKNWKKNNPEKVKALSSRYYERNKEKIGKRVSHYAKKNPDVRKAQWHRRRALKIAADGDFTADEWLALCERFDNLCLCCKKKKPLHADHVVPLSKGGSNGIENIQPLCKSCNSRKYVQSTDYR